MNEEETKGPPTDEPPEAGSHAPHPPAAPAGSPPRALSVVEKRAAWLVFAYLAACSAGAGYYLAGGARAQATRSILALPDAMRSVMAKHCQPALPSPVPSPPGQAPPSPVPGAGAQAASQAPAAEQICGPSIARGLLEDAFYALVLLGVVGGSLSGLWSLVMYLGYDTFRTSWVAYYLIRPLAGAVAAPSILFGLELFQLRPSSVQVCVFLAFLASVAVQHYMKKVFDLACTLFHPTDDKEEKYLAGAKS